MTIQTQQSQQTVYGNGVTTVFPINFTPDSTEDIEVIYTNTLGVQTTLNPTAYLIALNPVPVDQLWAQGFSVTYPLSGTPISNGTSLLVQRVIPLEQNTDLNDQGNFYAQVVEEGLDVLEMQLQQVAARTGKIRGTWVSGVAYAYSDIVVDGVNGSDTNNIYNCSIANLSGVWATDLANGLWSLALNVQGIINSLPSIPNNDLLANTSGVTNIPIATTVSALLDSALGNAQGSILYRSGAAWVVLPPGTNGQVLKTQGSSANPIWGSASGSGTVTSVASGTGLTGGPISTTGTLSLATIADQSFLANVSGGTAAPGATTLSAFLDEVLGSTQGSVIYRGGSVWSALSPGSASQLLQSGGSGANPSWYGAASLGTNGYVRLPFGIIFQWGQTGTLSGGNNSISFNINFPTSVFIVVASPNGSQAAATSTSNCNSFTTSGFNFDARFGTPTGSGTNTATWMAVGN